MRLLRAAAPAFALSCLTALLVTACGSSERAGAPGAGNGTAGNGNGNGSAGTLNIKDPNLGSGNGSSVGDGGAGSIDACAGETIQAERIPLDMYVMLDVSGSMLAPTVGKPTVTKWQAVSGALSQFVADPQSAGLGMGMQVFPIAKNGAPASCTSDAECEEFGPCFNRSCWPLHNMRLDACYEDSDCEDGQTCKVIGECSRDARYACDPMVSATCGMNRGNCTLPTGACINAAMCTPATYQMPASPIEVLPMGADAIVQVINGATPKQGALTPTGPALTGAVEEATTWAKAHPDHQVVAVLATDGLPTLQTKGQLCEPVRFVEDIDAVINIAGVAQKAQPSISTFLIGVVSDDDVAIGATDIMDAIAQAGGTDQAFLVNTNGDVQSEFRNALNKIRSAGLSCDLAIPKPEAGKTLDFGLVNVQFDDGSGAVTLGNVASGADCGTGKRWYYDVDPKAGTPTRILTCPAACDAFQKTDMGSVKIVLGCETEVVVK